MQATGRLLLRPAQKLHPAEMQRTGHRQHALSRGLKRHLGLLPLLVGGQPVRVIPQDPVRGAHLSHRGRTLRIRRRVGDESGHDQGVGVRAEENVSHATGRSCEVSFG